MSTGRKVLFSFVILLIVFSLAEVFAYVAGRMLYRAAVFYRPDASSDAYHRYVTRDPVLGWPPPAQFGGERYDESGSRRIPAFPEPGNACVSIYGDSFTYGSGVSDETAWSNQLSKLLGCRVANYGVGGYGSDQATLRFEQNVHDEAPVVILGHLSENILRNLNRYRRLIAAEDVFGLKPRFVLSRGGGLQLLPIHPVDSAEEFVDLAANPERILEHDSFVPGGSAGIQHHRFPFTFSMLVALRHYHFRAELAGHPGYTEFYDRDHPAQGLELTSRIFERFAAKARERGKVPVLQVIPTGLDLLEYQKTGRWTYGPLIERTRERGLDVVDLGRRLMTLVGDGDPCALYLRCNTHLNALGNELLARQVKAALDERRPGPSAR